MTGALARGKPTIVLQTCSNEKVNLPVRHVCDFLDGLLGAVIVGQECQLFGKFGIDSLLDEPE